MYKKVVMWCMTLALAWFSPVNAATADELLKAVGENAYNYFGYSVSSAGDVNGDGYDDIIVGADYYDDGSNTAVGATYIFYGGPSMDSI